MGFFDYVGEQIQKKEDSIVNTYKKKLRSASDATVLRKMEQVQEEYDCNSSYGRKLFEATEKELRRRGLR